MFDQIEERLKNARRQRHLRVRPPQKALSCVQAEIAKLVNARRRSIHREFHKVSEKFSRILRTFRPVCWKKLPWKNGYDSVTDKSNKREGKNQEKECEDERPTSSRWSAWRWPA